MRWLATRGKVTRDADGRARRRIGVVADITARKVAEEALAAAANRLHHVSEAGRLAVWQIEREGLIHDPDLNAVLGWPAGTKMTPDDIRSLYLPGELERLREITAATWARGQRAVEVEAQIRRPDGEVRWVMLRGELGLDSKGQVRAAMGVTVDITERKTEEERMNLLAQEVNHRANNLLAVVQGAVQLSQAPTPEQLKAVVLGRIKALGRANQLLSAERWVGADLHGLVADELAPFSLGEDGRVTHEGPAVALNASAAQSLALALHELATNAAKYGALTTAAGRVSVSWKRDRQGLTVIWRESGGPPVTEPTRKGQGVTLLAHALAGSLGGASTLHWRPEGLICTLELPPEGFEPAEPPQPA
jgi:PAS domain S-box-containing protein